jgi:cytochrome c oxidase subunit 4
MSHSEESHIHGPASLVLYIANFSALMVLTVLTIWAGMQDFGSLNTVIALGIAIVKAVLVILFFMHVIHSSPLTKLTIFASLFFLAIMILMILSDYLTRGFTGGLN